MAPPGIFERVNNYYLLIYALACFLMYYSVSGLLILGGQVVLSFIIPGVISFVVPLFVLSRRFSLSFTGEYRLRAPTVPAAALVLLVSGSAILPVDAVSSFVETRWPPEADYINFLLSIKPKGILGLVAIASGTVVVSPFCEELLFRGFIQRIFQRNMTGTLAVLLSSAIFALCHFSVAMLPGIFLLGIVLGLFFLRTGNLAYPVLGHALFNLVALARLHMASEEALRSTEIAAPSMAWTSLSLVVLVLSIYTFMRLPHGGE